jgi:hypothetical protein
MRKYNQTKKRSWTAPDFMVMTALAFAMAFGLVSCVDVTPEGYVEKQWSAQIRELGIVPVYPPREDVQVGDVYILPESPDELDASLHEKGYVPLGVWACQLNLNDQISSFYKQRSSFPFTSTNLPSEVSGLTNNPNGIVSQDRSSNSIFTGNGDNGRLRLVGFPQFMSATFTEGDLSALIPIEAVSLSLATSYSDAKSVTVSVPVAESYGIPAATIQSYLSTGNPDVVPPLPHLPIGTWKNFYLLAPAKARQRDSNGTLYIYGIVINEVYYTRAIDVSIQSQRGSATTVNASVTGAQQAQQATKAISQTTQASTNAAGVTTTNNIVSTTYGDPIARANALNANNAANLSNLLTPGGKLNFVSVSDGAVSMRRVYSSPVAIGIRAIEFTIDENGNVIQQGAYSGAAPPAKAKPVPK